MATAKQSPEFTLEVRRTFSSPREKVFAAWAQREQLEQWMCKDESAHTVKHHEQDIRTGGHYLMEVRDPAKGATYWGQGFYRELKPPRKIVFSWFWTKDMRDGPPLHPGSTATEVTVEFFVRGNSTEVVLTHAVFGSAKDRDDHKHGWNGCLDVLAKVLDTTSTPG